MAQDADVIVIGAGMAGGSVAAELAATHRVLLLERESQPGYHSTGRSAALYTRNYGNATIRGLARAGKAFYQTSGDGFSERPILSPRGALFVARHGEETKLAAVADGAKASGVRTETLDAAGCAKLSPSLRVETIAGGLLEPDAQDIDVHAQLTGFLRRFRAAGGAIETGAEIVALASQGGVWTVRLANGKHFRAPIVVNAGGAWADTISEAAGLSGVGITPKRRTAIIVDPPSDAGGAPMNPDAWPFTITAGEDLYFKPDGGRVMVSPADETPVPPCDVQADELDIAITVDRLQAITTFAVRHVRHGWAGLRSFAPDKSPVVGFDPRAKGFFWLAGQGGYGIKTAPALARVAAGLITEQGVPADILAEGVSVEALWPERLLKGLDGIDTVANTMKAEQPLAASQGDD